MSFNKAYGAIALTAALLSGFVPAENVPELTKMKTTAYCLQGKTYTESDVRNGICATGNKNLLGKTVVLYKRLPDNKIGDFIGIYEVEDTGCSQYVIDVWCADLDSCQEYMDLVYEEGCGGNVWVQVVEGKG